MTMTLQEKLKPMTPEQEVKALLKRGVITTPQLREMLKDKNTDKRETAVYIIRMGGVKELIPELSTMLTDKDDDVLTSVMQTLEGFNCLESAAEKFISFQRREGSSETQIMFQLKRIRRLAGLT